MSLLLEGALAARADAEVKQRLHETIAVRLDASARAFEARRDAEGFDPDIDLAAAVKMLWSIEIGLRALAALGFESPDEADCADVIRRLTHSLQVTPAAKASKKRQSKPAKAVGKKRAPKNDGGA